MTESLFLQAFKDVPLRRTPYWFMRQAGRFLPEYREVRSNFNSFLNFCYTPQAVKQVTLQPLKRFGCDAAILFSDIMVIPDALGMRVTFEEGEGPRLDPIKSANDMINLKQERVLSYLAPVFEGIELIRKELDREKALIGFSGAPWTLACYMIEGKTSRDFNKTREFSFGQYEEFIGLIDLLTNAITEYLKAQIAAGVDCVQLFDSWAGLVPARDFDQFVTEPTKKIVKEIKNRYPHIPIIGFAKGAGVNLVSYAQKTGLDAVGIDATTPMGWAKEQLGTVLLQGNLDPILLATDKQKAIRETHAILETMRGRPFIFNLGHGVVPHTPIENVEAVAKTIRAFN